MGKFQCNSKESAFTLLETCVSAALAALLLGSLFALSAQVYLFIKKAKETSYATQILAARVEALRSLNWTDVSNKTALQRVFGPDAMQAMSSSTVVLSGTSTTNFKLTSERLVATAYYPPPTTAPTGGAPAGIELLRNPDGSFAALPASSPNTGSSLAQVPAMRIRLTLSWSGAGGNIRQREITTFISHFGL
jgi:type II secretory pathway pseudopilin PulG